MANDFSLDVDAVIVGTGFSGVYMIRHLRNAGFRVKAFERGYDFGGTWHWNIYPGARVDSSNPIYQLFDDKIWNDDGWTWKERFPGALELQSYFTYLDKKWDLKKDVVFNTEVVGATFDESTHAWVVTCNDGTVTRGRWLFACTGFASRRYVPPFKGFDSFKGDWYHTGVWPRNGVDLKGKRVAVIGTGASGVQVVQEISSEVEHLTVYQRTPNLALPMVQTNLSEEVERKRKAEGEYASTFAYLRTTFGGMEFDWYPKNTNDDPPEEQRAVLEKLWGDGSFQYWLGAYRDMLYDKAANDVAYNFWAKKTRARINDPKKKDILAPLKAPHAFGTKRPCLEISYYECFNRPNVDIVDVSQDSIQITETGVRTSQGVVDVDVLIIATGYDSVTGGMTQIDIKGNDGINFEERWANGAKSYLGMTVAKYPNLFYTYGLHGPTAFSNGPTCATVQGEWLVQTLRDMREAGMTRIEATEEAQEKYTEKINQFWANSLFPGTKSWYQGSNIPGKPVQSLNWSGGMPGYIAEITASQDNGYEGFTLSALS